MPEFEDLLVAPWTRAALVHSTTNELPAPTMQAIADSDRLSTAINRGAEAFRRTVPAYVTGAGLTPAHVAEYNPALCLYNESAQDMLIARGDVKLAQQARADLTVLMVADSKGMGVGGGWINSIPNNLRESLGALDSMIYAHAALHSSDPDTRWSNVDGFTATGNNLHLNAASSGVSKARVQMNRKSTGMRVWFLSSGSLGARTASVDGGAAVSLASPTGTRIPPGSSTGYYYLDFTGLADVTHRIDISVTSTGGSFQLLGVEALHSSLGIRVVNAGLPGSTVAGWSPAATSPLSVFNASAGMLSMVGGRKLALVQLGTNTSADEIVGYQALAEKLRDLGFTVVILVPGGTTTSAGSRVNLKRALYEIAYTLSMPLIDFTDLIGNTTASARGYMTDSLHENARGYRLETGAIVRALCA